jgi:hypothetical protein
MLRNPRRNVLALVMFTVAAVAALYLYPVFQLSRAKQRAWYWGIGTHMSRGTNAPHVVPFESVFSNRLSQFIASTGMVERVLVRRRSVFSGKTIGADIVLKNGHGERMTVHVEPDTVVHKQRVVSFETSDP